MYEEDIEKHMLLYNEADRRKMDDYGQILT